MRTSALGSVVITDAHIMTQDPERPVARAAVVHDGRIEYVGTDEGAKHEDRGVDERIDAKGRTVVPGFNDAHGHFFHEGMLKIRLDLAEVKSLDELYRRIADYARANPDEEVLVAERWDESDWAQRVFPTREGLDAATGGRAILARRVDGHTAVASTPLLDIYRERWTGPTEGIHEDSGLLIEEPSLEFGDLVPASPEAIDHALGIMFDEARRLGITSVQGYERVNVWKGWQRRWGAIVRRGELPPVKAAISTYTQHLDAFLDAGMMTGTGDPWLRYGGVKIFADGAIGGWSAHLAEPYLDRPDTRGKQNFDDETLHDLVRRAHAGGIQVHMHVIGDAAVVQGCNAFSKVHETDPDGFHAMRHRFEHYEFGTDATHDEVKRLGIVLSMQPNFVGEWSAKEGLYGDRLGERHALTNPFRTIRDRGIPLAFGSDNMPFGPIAGIRGTMTGPYPQQRLDFDEALDHYTRGAAYAEFLEDEKGLVREDMIGDLVILSKDLRHEDMGDPSLLDGLDVHTTIADGRRIYSARHVVRTPA